MLSPTNLTRLSRKSHSVPTSSLYTPLNTTPLTTPTHNHLVSIYYNDHTLIYDKIHKNFSTPNTINFPTYSPLTLRPKLWPQSPIPSRPYNIFYNPTHQLHSTLSHISLYTQKYLPQTNPTSHRQTHSHRNQNLPSPEKTLSQTKQIMLHSFLCTPLHTPSKNTPSTTSSFQKNQIHTLIRIQKNTSVSQAINTPTYSLLPLTPKPCPQKSLAACPHIKSHNPMPQVYPTLNPHTIPYTHTYLPQISPKSHEQTHPRTYRNLLSHKRILTKSKQIMSNNPFYASSNTTLSTTPALIHIILIRNNAHTPISVKIQTDISSLQTIRTKKSSPPLAKRKSWPQSPPKICPQKTTHDYTPQLLLAPNPHTFPHTQKYLPKLSLTPYEQHHSCLYKTLPSHETIWLHTTQLTPNNHPHTPLHLSNNPIPNFNDQVTSQSKYTKPPLIDYTHNTSHPSHVLHIPSFPTPHHRIHSQTTTKPTPDFTYTHYCPLLNCHYLTSKINTHLPPKPIFSTILEYNNLSNPLQPHPYKHLTVNSAKIYLAKNPHISHILIFIL